MGLCDRGSATLVIPSSCSFQKRGDTRPAFQRQRKMQCGKFAMAVNLKQALACKSSLPVHILHSFLAQIYKYLFQHGSLGTYN